MKTKLTRLLGALGLVTLSTINLQLSTAHAQGTAFTYQGRLNNSGTPAGGLYDFRFKLYADPLGNTILATVTTNAIGVTNGLFTTTIDFGAGWFNGSNYWLEVDVRTNGAGGYTGLLPLQSLTPTPYAIFATTASNVSGTISAAQVSGMVANGNLPSSPTVTGTVSAGSFSGNGANVTNVNAAALNGLTSASFWQTNGNAGANPTNGAFLGTTDLQPLELHVNGQRALRLEPGISGQGAPNVIGGSFANFVVAGVYGATIGGGGGTNIGDGYAANSVSANFATVGGGLGNIASGIGATVGGGGIHVFSKDPNTASGSASFVGGGWANTASGDSATVSGGVGNLSRNDVTTVGGGYVNQATGYSATVPGGFQNLAGGAYSFAAGTFAQALHQGAFVWADSQQIPFASTANDQFLIRAQGGVGIGTTNPAAALDVNGTVNAATFTGGSIGLGTTFPSFAVDVLAGQAVARLITTNNSNGADIELKNTTSGTTTLGAINFNNSANGYPGQIAYLSTDNLIFRVGGVNRMTLNSSGLTVNGTFVSSSDRNLKENFQPVSAADVLAKVAAMPVTRWNYKEDQQSEHIGPMAQDFYAAFGVGPDDRHITTIDESGVALAAIQGLNQKLEETRAENAELKNQNDSLVLRLSELEKTVKSLAAKN